MQRERGELVPVGDALSDLPGPVKRGREMIRRLRAVRRNNVLTTMLTGLAIALALFAFTLPAKAQQAEQPDKYLLMATNRTGTMEDELNEAGARGYRFAGTQGGQTVFGGDEAVVIMTLDPEGRRFRYILLATNRTGTMQREMNQAPPEYAFVGMTVFSSTFGGRQTAVILESAISVAPASLSTSGEGQEPPEAADVAGAVDSYEGLRVRTISEAQWEAVYHPVEWMMMQPEDQVREMVQWAGIESITPEAGGQVLRDVERMWQRGLAVQREVGRITNRSARPTGRQLMRLLEQTGKNGLRKIEELRNELEEAVQLAGKELSPDDLIGRILNPTVERVSWHMASAWHGALRFVYEAEEALALADREGR